VVGPGLCVVGGMLLFVVWEIGMVPVGVRLGGVHLERIVVVFGALLGSDDPPVAYHLVPAEYLVDPALPGLPPNLLPSQVQHWLPSPPEFSRGRLVGGCSGLSYAMVGFKVSLVEWDEGSVALFGLVLRGASYCSLRGLSLY